MSKIDLEFDMKWTENNEYIAYQVLGLWERLQG